MTQVLFIGGPPGIGKSTVARCLLSQLDGAVWFDGDDLWRMDPRIVTPSTRQLVERNAIGVIGNAIEAGMSTVLFTWILHRPDLIARLTTGLAKLGVEPIVTTLTAALPVWVDRYRTDPSRTALEARHKARFDQCLRCGARIIDTTDRTAEDVATELGRLLSEAARS